LTGSILIFYSSYGQVKGSKYYWLWVYIAVVNTLDHIHCIWFKGTVHFTIVTYWSCSCKERNNLWEFYNYLSSIMSGTGQLLYRSYLDSCIGHIMTRVVFKTNSKWTILYTHVLYFIYLFFLKSTNQ